MTTFLKDGSTVEDPRLGRVKTGHTRHLDKFPLTAATMPEKPKPVVAGVNWYRSCFTPELVRIQSRPYWAIGRPIPGSGLGPLDGGHAVCLPPWGSIYYTTWWDYYNQGTEGRCVEFAWLRTLTLLNRKKYDITSRWHYYEMQRRDWWPGGSYPGAEPQYEGTSVDAGAQVMHQFGAIPYWRNTWMHLMNPRELVRPDEGIGTYRWAQTWDDVRAVTGTPDWLPGVVFLNSWGRDYPHRTLMLDELGDRLLREDGEFCVVSDK